MSAYYTISYHLNYIAAALQSRLESLQSQYDTDTKRLEERIEKLEGDLRSKSVVTRRRVVQPTVVVPVESPSTTVTVQAGEGEGREEKREEKCKYEETSIL